MMLKHLTISSALLLSMAAAMAESQGSSTTLSHPGLFVNGATPVEITLSNHQKKIVRLMSVSLSPKAKAAVADKATFLLSHPFQKNLMASDGLPPAKYIGMNGEDVLDQGAHGSCATFATTAAINAVYPLTDGSMVSQLCNLELGRTIDNPDSYGGWEGSFGFLVFWQINQYGYLDMAYQRAQGCGGLKEYPTYSYDTGAAMPKGEFTSHSIKTFTSGDWTPIVSFSGDFSPLNEQDAQAALGKVKSALNQGYRVVFGTLLDPYAEGRNNPGVGAVGSYNGVAKDVWVMTAGIKSHVENQAEIAGHEIIIDGYDDNACATWDNR
ncbi:MAG: hypothetical protein A3E84_05835, partial [Gammaproteobacteria bacterium RIFCSPHIGHO2_12_FULL_42_13]